ncbi:MAG: hypothetical protein SGPRY_007874 [Prymnesium sp.]
MSHPAVGKTTLVRAVTAELVSAGKKVGGFYTEERRGAGGVREGFDVVSLDGVRGRLASLGSKPPLVGKYSVSVASFEAVALQALQAGGVDLMCVDEVGKMELYAHALFPRVLGLLDDSSGPRVFGTLPMPRYGHTVAEVEQLRARDDVAVVKLLKGTRDEACAAVLRVLSQPHEDGASLDVTSLLPFLQEGQLSKLSRLAPLDHDTTPHDASALLPSAIPTHGTYGCEPLIGSIPPSSLLLGLWASPMNAPETPKSQPYAERSFWNVLCAALELRSESSYEERRDAVVAAGVAIWDVMRNVHDAPSCEPPQPSDVLGLAGQMESLRQIAFNGKRAHDRFVEHHRAAVDKARSELNLGGRKLKLVVLPSSSRAAAMPLTQKAAIWRDALFRS